MDLTNTYTTYDAMMTAFRGANFGIVRWPMASISDYYHWQTNSFSSCASVWNPIARTTFDQFMQQVAQPLGVDVNITVNYGSNSTCTGVGDPNEAAAWVDYANNQMHYGIKYWSIGNEQYYGDPTLGLTPTTPDFNVSPTDPGSVGSATYASLIASQGRRLDSPAMRFVGCERQHASDAPGKAVIEVCGDIVIPFGNLFGTGSCRCILRIYPPPQDFLPGRLSRCFRSTCEFWMCVEKCDERLDKFESVISFPSCIILTGK